MARTFIPQFTFTQGILDSDLYQRGDLRSYYGGIKDSENCFCKLTGGISRRYGTEYVDSLPPIVTAESLTAGNFTIPNLATGTAANLIDGSRSTIITTNNITSSPFIVFNYDLGSVKNISYIDIFDSIINGYTAGIPLEHYKLEISSENVAYGSVTTWTNVPAGDLGDYFCEAKKQDLSFFINAQARHLRFYLSIPFAGNTISISEVKIYSYSAVNENIQMHEVYLNKDGIAEFFPVLIVFGSYHAHLYYTLGNTTVFMNSIYTGIEETYNKTMSLTNGDRGRIIVTDNSLTPKEIVFLHAYNGSAGTCSFRSTDIPLLNIPKYEYEVNDHTPTNTLTPSATTGYITLTAGGAEFQASDVGTKINIEPVGIVRIVGYTSTTVVEGFVEQKLSSTAAITAANWKIERGWEDIISSTRGWPLCSAFYNGRLYFGGSRSISGLLLASTIEDNYDFDLADQTDSDGFWRVIQARGNSQITSMQSYNTLEIYTLSGVYTLANGAVTPQNVSIRRTSSEGILQYTDAEEIENSGSIYVDRTNDAVYQLVYTEDLASYQSKLISQLAGSLVEIKDEPNYCFGVWKGDRNFRANQLFSINNSNQIITATLFLSENVSAFTKLEIKYTEPSTDVLINATLYTLKPCKNGIAIACKASGSSDKYSLIFMREGRYLDFSRILTPSGTTVTVGTDWDGEKLDIIASGEHLGTFTVSSGDIALPAEYNEVEVGWPFYAFVETLPIENLEQIGSSIAKYRNISEVYINPKSIANLYINDQLVFNYNNNTAQTEPFVERNIKGWDRSKTLKLSQQKPLEFQIKNILMKTEINN